MGNINLVWDSRSVWIYPDNRGPEDYDDERDEYLEHEEECDD